MSWTDERIERLKKLWTDGLSASQIAAEMGGVTRNAVIGKVHRLGLSGRTKTPASVAARPRKPIARPQPPRGGGGGSSGVTSAVARGNLAVAQVVEAIAQPVMEARADVVISISRRISIMELREGVCRWPLGDPLAAEFAFCGADCTTSKVYCQHHSRLAFVPQERRRNG